MGYYKYITGCEKRMKTTEKLNEKRHTWGKVPCRLPSPYYPPLRVLGSGSFVIGVVVVLGSFLWWSVECWRSAVEVVELNSLLTCCVYKSRDLKRETRTTRENRETHDPNPRKPVPVARVWVFTGWGPGWPGIPQGYPCYSLGPAITLMSSSFGFFCSSRELKNRSVLSLISGTVA